MEKRKNVRGVWLFAFFIFLFLLNNIFALGMSPAREEFNFKPGFEEKIGYNVFSDTGRDIEISAEGDLAQYVTFNKEVVSGGKGGNFVAILKLPNSLDEPGLHRTFVKVAEKVVDEELSGFFVVKVSVMSIIDVYVPYPGRYLEIGLVSKDVNIGEPVEFGLTVVSRGTDDIDISPKIDIYDLKGNSMETLFFTERNILGQETLKLKKILNTTNYNPGTYKAKALIDYGIPARAETEFRIGDLNVKLLNYTNLIPIGKLEKFDLVVESGWNNNIEGVSAKIYVMNGSRELAQFETSTTQLTPWEQKTLTGYFDTSNFTEGIYDANISLR